MYPHLFTHPFFYNTVINFFVYTHTYIIHSCICAFIYLSIHQFILYTSIFVSFYFLLIVAVDRSAPIIIYPPEATYVPLYSKVNLSCVATGYPQPVITWYKDDERIDNAITPFYIIEALTLDTRGLYSCSASNEEGMDESDKAYIKIKGDFNIYWNKITVVEVFFIESYLVWLTVHIHRNVVVIAKGKID